MRPWLVWSTLVLATIVARPAAAQDALNGGRVDIELWLPKDGKEQSMNEADFEKIDPGDTTDRVTRYFNGARCTCDRHSTKAQNFLLKITFADMLDPNPALTTTVPLDVFAGEMCSTADTNNTRFTRCSKLDTISDAGDLTTEVAEIFGRASEVLAPGAVDDAEMQPNDCRQDRTSSEFFVVADAQTQMPLDANAAAVKLGFDLRPPAMPTTLTAIGLESSIKVSWDGGMVDTDTQYFQALCTKADGTPAHLDNVGGPSPQPAPRFDTTLEMCDEPITAPNAAELDDGTVPEGELPEVLLELNTQYVCGEASDSATSITLSGLENGVSYWVVVLAIDSAGNYDARYVPHVVSPVPSIDFWEDANAENGDVNGGFCIAQVGGDASAASALLVLGAVTAAVRRRRRRRSSARGAALTTLAALVLAPTVARAQDYDPYWIDADADSTARDDVPAWHLGLRFGPYHPSVDDKYMSDPGPYRRMFGPGYNIVPQLDLHRLWNLTAVQLGVGMSGGYYAKSADAYETGSSPTDPDRPRSEGATNTFKMVPLSLTGLARLTVLDDRWGVPIVPYVRGGVAYNVWWVRTATDELAVACDTCEDKALGASAGLVGAVGISIRGERIDPEASHSMKNGGVEHAGFYAELETSWVDGFGNAKRMSLGDTTWYAGVDFEF